ncbi:site-specific integrase [Ruegeria sp. HKCCD8929]|uniref:tyrosine-type recombinase/integrase n=1 Tax=Ruegeria sp. HKCCD8929 TaxID=2683006 RepID=UPI0014893A4F|nr:site-specific integrase [Ruegeria sp. HKCCD8929]
MAGGINKLTAVAIKNAPDGKLEDGGGLRLTKKGAGGKWIYRYSFAKRRREMGLGSYPEVSLAEARKQRGYWQHILQGGKDPISERERVRADELTQLAKDDPLFEDMAVAVFEAIRGGLRGDGTRGRWLSPVKVHVIPKIGRKRLSEIHQTDIRDAIAPIWKTKHETADKALYRTRKIFHQAKLMGYEVDPFTVDAARHMLGHYDQVVTPIVATPWQDIPDLYARLHKPTPVHRSLRWAILTAARGDGVRGARFDEFDGDVWTIPADRMKGQRGKVSDFRVPLSDEALRLLEECKADAVSDHLFPSPRKGCITVQAQIKILGKLGEKGRPHGFRTSFRSWVQDTDAASYDVAETALAHVIGNKVERSYARSDLLDKRHILMQKWAEFVTGSEAKVIPLRGRS